MTRQRLPVDTETASGPTPHVEVRMPRVEELAKVLADVPWIVYRDASLTAYSDAPDYAELARAALAWMAERVPHLERLYLATGIETIVIEAHYHNDALPECRDLGGRCAWEEK